MPDIIAKKGLGLFYEVSREAINHVAQHSSRAALVMSYMALKRHQQKANRDVVTAGRNSIVNTLHTSRPKAIKLINDLKAVAWGQSYRDTALMDVQHWNQMCAESDEVPLGAYGANKIMPPCGEGFIYLPNHLNMCGQGQDYSPLGQIYRLPGKTLQLDAMMLLLGLYEHLDMYTYGGADPTTTVNIPFRYEGIGYDEWPLELGYLGECNGLHYWAVDVRGKDGDYWAIQLTKAHWSFIESITGETPVMKAPRFWTAWQALRDLGLAYHATMVFDADPQLDPDAEILYPLWVWNRAERERLNQRGYQEGGLTLLAQHRARRDYISEDLEYSLIDAFKNRTLMCDPVGFFIAAAHNPEAKVVGILRPRFIPNTQDGQAGWASLRDKAINWTRILEADK